jgi:hypothetical protein
MTGPGAGLLYRGKTRWLQYTHPNQTTSAGSLSAGLGQHQIPVGKAPSDKYIASLPKVGDIPAPCIKSIAPRPDCGECYGTFYISMEAGKASNTYVEVQVLEVPE